jgi:hypothetical protein
MIDQIAQAITFDAFFTLDGAGATGLTVTVDVYRGATKIVDNVAATEVAGGFYTYALAGASNTEKNHYRAVFKTADTVDQAHIPALWIVGSTWVERVDATIDSRLATAGYTAPLDAAGVRGAVGMAAADLDTQLDAVALEATVAALQKDVDDLYAYALSDSSGWPDGPVLIQNRAKTAARISASFDANGNRTVTIIEPE